ncbi:hypothetical protein Q2941_11095 [Bradyrhizobium sp. UFLA05-153]
MTEPVPPMLAKPSGDELARAKMLAETMAAVLMDEDVTDAAVAIALLTCSVVNYYARDRADAAELLSKIRRVEDWLLAKAGQAAKPTLQ